MNVTEAGRIYETARKENIAEDLILGLEGLSREEYRQALKLYIKTLPKVDITMGWEEELPKYELWQGTRFPQWM